MKHPILRRIPGARQWLKKIERLEAERDRLRRRLDKLEASLHQAQNTTSPSLRRDQYKAVWTKLSETEDSAKFYIGGFQDEETFEREGARTKEHLIRSVGIYPDDIVVEIGCGVGRVGKQLAPLCRKWIGCDVSPHMLALSAKHLEEFDNVELHEISGFDLAPLPNECADVVYCTVVFMHLDEWDRYNYVVEAHRVLRSGGRFFVDNVDLASEWGWNVFEAHRRFPPNQRPPHITKHSTAQELTTYLQRAGFRHITTRAQGEFIQVWGSKAETITRVGGEIAAFLDTPTPGDGVYADSISVSGWVYSSAAPVSEPRIRAWIGNEMIGETSLTFVRPDVCAALALPDDTPTGFRLLGQTVRSETAELRVTANFGTEEIEIGRRRVRLLPSALAQQPVRRNSYASANAAPAPG